MLAIFAIALALGLTTAMSAIPMLPEAFADKTNRQKACGAAGANHVPHCRGGGGGD